MRRSGWTAFRSTIRKIFRNAPDGSADVNGSADIIGCSFSVFLAVETQLGQRNKKQTLQSLPQLQSRLQSTTATKQRHRHELPEVAMKPPTTPARPRTTSLPPSTSGDRLDGCTEVKYKRKKADNSSTAGSTPGNLTRRARNARKQL